CVSGEGAVTRASGLGRRNGRVRFARSGWGWTALVSQIVPCVRRSSTSRSFARARPARSLRMTTPRGSGEKKEREGGFSLSPSRSERACHPERRRREGPAFPQARRTHPFSAASADDLRCGVSEQQVLRSRASRALAQDDNAGRLRGKRKRTCFFDVACVTRVLLLPRDGRYSQHALSRHSPQLARVAGAPSLAGASKP